MKKPITIEDVAPTYLDEWAKSLEDHDEDCECDECVLASLTMGPESCYQS